MHRSRAVFLAVAVLFSSCVVGCSDAGPTVESSSADVSSWKASYADLADARVPTTFESVVAELASFDEGTMPHEAKSLRKRIGELRDYIDLFAFAYSKDGPGDPWRRLREALDEGYETMGAFKDLFDATGATLAVQDLETGNWSDGIRPEGLEYIEYTSEKKVEERRDAVLEWKVAFFADLDAHRAAVSNADHSAVHKRDGLSRFFWGGAKEKPSLDRSGLDNLGRLVGSLLELALEDFDSTKELDDIVKLAAHEEFHDFRKRVRSVVKTVDYFPELLESDAAKPLEMVRELVDRYGALNDALLTLSLETKRSKREALEKKIEKDWKALREWQKDERAGDQISKLRKRVRRKP